MRLTIRDSAFETNSSSMHSIIVKNNDNRNYTKEELESDLYLWKGELDLSLDEDILEFGRAPFRLLCTMKEKLCYAIAAYCSWEDPDVADEEFQKIFKLVQKHVPELKKIALPERTEKYFIDKDGNTYQESEVRNSWTDAPYVQRNGDEAPIPVTEDPANEFVFPYYGNIDHQSDGMLQAFLEKQHVSLEDFLFKPRYVIVIDGDEYCELDKIVHYGIIDMASVTIYDECGNQTNLEEE